ncbi:hypothetical protein COCSUDRAFT_55200 [Coccomyxa subellipsoidea C-169]|uniref:Uncharacterized protein n=1 Tax=Coccomyxa subellipsoidea (strain C-169) TaxID=574566 RepID=I0Z958_COCSC|nr:hypothetical protein COCSUDRAFT_55200 [Coccomyxa subellipsoidea C-169]EIE27177.1 hypothetical protein COCSUDRAFT_55200 [Coccomyxa subellipsoidea C-169]|eukprot:XP_005651721.1 hypothetical protein COCSUDRAFT_55200 [Coccomyxa subellipsoidea C-169]
MSGGQLSSSQNGQPLFTSNNSRGSKARSLTSQEAFAILRNAGQLDLQPVDPRSLHQSG